MIPLYKHECALTNMDDLFHRLFKMATDLNEVKGKNEDFQFEWWGGGGRDLSGAGVLLCLRRDGRQDSHVKTFLSFSSFSFSLNFSPTFFFIPSLSPCLCSGQKINRRSWSGGLIMSLF